MSEVAARTDSGTASGPRVNVADRLTAMTVQMPDAVAVVVPRARRKGPRQYDTFTFGQLDNYIEGKIEEQFHPISVLLTLDATGVPVCEERWIPTVTVTQDLGLWFWREQVPEEERVDPPPSFSIGDIFRKLRFSF